MEAASSADARPDVSRNLSRGNRRSTAVQNARPFIVPGYLYIREDKVYGFSGFEMLHFLIRIAVFYYLHACLAQHFCYVEPDQDFILNEKHRANLSLGNYWHGSPFIMRSATH